MTTRLQWVVAHEPYYLFENAIKQFADEVRERTNGEYEVELMSIRDWGLANNVSVDASVSSRGTVIDLARNGDIQILTTYVESLAHVGDNGLYRDFSALGMPYLFSGHDHATRVLDGTIGDSILSQLSGGIVGLAFTYSGGYRIYTGRNAIRTLEDFSGVRTACSLSDVSKKTVEHFGGTPVQIQIDYLKECLDNNEADIGSTTWARFFTGNYETSADYISETHHSMFLTCMVMNEGLFNSLPAEVQTIFREAAKNAAKVERVESVADNDVIKTRAIAAGIEVVVPSAEETERMKLATRPLYDELKDTFSPGLLDDILAA